MKKITILQAFSKQCKIFIFIINFLTYPFIHTDFKKIIQN